MSWHVCVDASCNTICVSAEQICDLAEVEFRHQRTDTTVHSIVAAGLKRTGAASNGAEPSRRPSGVTRRRES